MFQQAILHQMLSYLQDDFLRVNGTGATITRQDTLVCELVNYINLHIGEDLSLEDPGAGDQLQSHLPLPDFQKYYQESVENLY